MSKEKKRREKINKNHLLKIRKKQNEYSEKYQGTHDTVK